VWSVVNICCTLIVVVVVVEGEKVRDACRDRDGELDRAGLHDARWSLEHRYHWVTLCAVDCSRQRAGKESKERVDRVHHVPTAADDDDLLLRQNQLHSYAQSVF